jgi:predicted PurR-regulated permease PerM
MTPRTLRQPFFVGLIIAVSLAFGAVLLNFWQPIFWAVVIGLLFHPVEVWLSERIGGRRSLASVLTVILIFFTVIVPTLLLGSAVAAEATALYQRVQSGEIDIGAPIHWLQGLLPQASEWLARFGIDLSELPQRLSSAAVAGGQFIASMSLDVGQDVAAFILNFFLMLYLLFFVLRDGDLIMQAIHRAMPLPDDQEERLVNKFSEVTRATVKGTLVVGLVQGFLGGLIFAILGIEGAVLWGVAMAVLSLLPAVGAGLVWAPAAVILVVVGDWIQGLVLLAYGVLVISMVDNLLRPILVGRDTKMPDFLVLLSTLGGLSLVGITGFVLGPAIAALFIAVWHMYTEDRERGQDSTLMRGRDAPAAGPAPARAADSGDSNGG